MTTTARTKSFSQSSNAFSRSTVARRPLTPEDRAAILAREKAEIWIPNQGPQTEAYDTPAFETLFGGAAGGGKSSLILGLARLEHINSLLLRRTYPEVDRVLIRGSMEFYGNAKSFNASKYLWRFGKRSIQFGHMESDKAMQAYQGTAFDLIAFDEVTAFTKTQYRFMFRSARTTREGQRVRIIATTNPGGDGNDWVMERWAPWLDEAHPCPAKSGEIRWFRPLPDGREEEVSPGIEGAMSRTFIASRLSDNPYLGPEYRAVLDTLPEPFRSQLLNGDWKVGQTDDAYQVIPRAWVRAAQARWVDRVRLGPLSELGVAPARGGQDKTVLARRYGAWFARLEAHDGRTTPDGPSVVALIEAALGTDGKAPTNVDVIGIGSSVYDIATMRRMPVAAINFSEKSESTDKTGRLKFANQRAEFYWRFRELLDPQSGLNVALPPDPELMGDLCAPRFEMRTNGIHLRSKDEIKELLGRSPDKGDAIVLASTLLSVAGSDIDQADLAGEIRDSMADMIDEHGAVVAESLLDEEF